MNDLIEAFTIFAKYSQAKYPTCCEHDTLYVNVDPAKVSEDDAARLDELGFYADRGEQHYYSYRYGSC